MPAHPTDNGCSQAAMALLLSAVLLAIVGCFLWDAFWDLAASRVTDFVRSILAEVEKHI